MSSRTRSRRQTNQINPVIFSVMASAMAVYVACCGIVLAAAYTEHKRPDRPQTARDSRPRQPEIGPQPEVAQPAVTSGVNWVSYAIGG